MVRILPWVFRICRRYLLRLTFFTSALILYLVYVADVPVESGFKLNDDSIDYLRRYEISCERFHRTTKIKAKPTEEMPYCKCVPDTLQGTVPVNMTIPDLSELEALAASSTSAGGEWQPSNCIANQKVAIIIPYRDREQHFRIFMRHMIPILRRQLVYYRIFLVEQILPEIFNKGSLMNIGYMEVMKIFDPDCIIFNDVDTLLENDLNMYHCRPTRAIHLGAYVDRFFYRLPYNRAFGAVTSFYAKDFKTIGGFSVEFFGWGGEDDDMSRRTEYAHVPRMRPPNQIARYKLIPHKRDEGNPMSDNRYDGLNSRPRQYTTNTLRYMDFTTKTKNQPLYTHILSSFYPRTKPMIGDGQKGKETKPKNSTAR